MLLPLDRGRFAEKKRKTEEELVSIIEQLHESRIVNHDKLKEFIG